MAVVISTYNKPDWLRKVLWGYENQTCADFETVIADDGSGEETRQLVEWFANRGRLRMKHVWHPDQGFRKTTILNKAITSTAADYIVMTDGDCIPRADFVATHLRLARPGAFLSGGYYKLATPVSEAITEDDILHGRPFDYRWLRAQGQPANPKLLRLGARGTHSRMLDQLTTTRATWNGMNSSTWRHLLLAVNGFNEDMEYGGEDRELGERLVNSGVRPRQIRHSALCVHLEHTRGYVSQQAILRNHAIREHTRRTRLVWTPRGIVHDPQPEPAPPIPPAEAEPFPTPSAPANTGSSASKASGRAS